MGNENVMVMCLVFVLAGAFSGSIKAAGGVDSTVNFGLSIMPPQIAVAGLFIIGCFISTGDGHLCRYHRSPDPYRGRDQ